LSGHPEFLMLKTFVNQYFTEVVLFVVEKSVFLFWQIIVVFENRDSPVLSDHSTTSLPSTSKDKSTGSWWNNHEKLIIKPC